MGWQENGIPGRITKEMGSGTEGENVAWGYPTPEAAFLAWFNETPPNDGHRRNILNCNFTSIGVGIAYAPNSVLHAGLLRLTDPWSGACST
ncbi:CAP domain-containing protein [Streptomyces sp. NPDC047860]|uniref:CAP domain-containing protein n=1 Tax=Streptomyces sp. NPDC047860 TaxID=3155743 RepID=UPI0033CFED49